MAHISPCIPCHFFERVLIVGAGRVGSAVAKSALLAMSQSLASELGEQGIRVNSVLPGYIWGGTLESYFNHQAKKYGTTVEEIYRATAAASAATPVATTCSAGSVASRSPVCSRTSVISMLMES